MAWPSIQSPAKISAKYHKAQHRSKFETGRTLVRAKHVLAARTWTLEWPMMDQTDLDALLSAFNSDQGTTFTWTHPSTTTSYTVCYGTDEITFVQDAERADRYQVSVTLEEVAS